MKISNEYNNLNDIDDIDNINDFENQTTMIYIIKKRKIIQKLKKVLFLLSIL